MTQVILFQLLRLVANVIQDINIFTFKTEIASIVTNTHKSVEAAVLTLNSVVAARARHHGIATFLTSPLDGSC
jgi:hypothetical protein